MRTVAAAAGRRWAMVAVAMVVICLVPVAMAARAGPRVQADPQRLRAAILGSAGQPYQGYADTRSEIGLPDLPVLSTGLDLVGGALRLRAWYASPGQWRVAVLSTTGERDLYRHDGTTYVWDFERNLMTQIVGDAPVRLPEEADLLPPELARRMLSLADPGDPIQSLPGRRIAGVAAAGLRLRPASPDTLVGAVDVWADPETGLPVQVDLTARGGSRPIYSARFLELSQRRPPARLIAPLWPDTAGLTEAAGSEVASAVNGLVPVALPGRLAGLDRTNPRGLGVVRALGRYGDGFATFVVLALPGRTGYEMLHALSQAGGVPVQLDATRAYELTSPVLSALGVQSRGDRTSRHTFLLVGPVRPELLRRAAADLLAATAAVP